MQIILTLFDTKLLPRKLKFAVFAVKISLKKMQALQSWMNNGKWTNSFKSLQKANGSTQLQSVEYCLLRNSNRKWKKKKQHHKCIRMKNNERRFFLLKTLSDSCFLCVVVVGYLALADCVVYSPIFQLYGSNGLFTTRKIIHLLL